MNRILRRLAATVILAGVAIFSAPNFGQAQTNLIVNCIWLPQHFICQKVLPTWIEDVNKATSGRVKVSQLAMNASAPAEQLSSVEKGAFDIAIQFNGLIQNRVIGPSVTMTPFSASDDSEAMTQALWETRQKYFPDEFKTVQLLSLFVFEAGKLFSTTDKPVTSMSDLKSRKVWTLPGTVAEIVKKTGAGAVATPAVKSIEIISRGVVDAHFGMGHQDLQGLQLSRYSKSVTMFRNSVMAASFSFIVNADKWKSISEADQKAIMEVSGLKFGKAVASAQKELTQKALAAQQAEGMKVVNADPEFEKQLTEESQFMTQRWLDQAKQAGIDAQGAYDFYVKRVKELTPK